MPDKETKAEREEREEAERVQNDRINDPSVIRPTQGMQIIDPVTGKADGYRPIVAHYVPNVQPGYVDVPPGMRTPAGQQMAEALEEEAEAKAKADAKDEKAEARSDAKHDADAKAAADAKAKADAKAEADAKAAKKD